MSVSNDTFSMQLLFERAMTSRGYILKVASLKLEFRLQCDDASRQIQTLDFDQNERTLKMCNAGAMS